MNIVRLYLLGSLSVTDWSLPQNSPWNTKMFKRYLPSSNPNRPVLLVQSDQNQPLEQSPESSWLADLKTDKREEQSLVYSLLSSFIADWQIVSETRDVGAKGFGQISTSTGLCSSRWTGGIKAFSSIDEEEGSEGGQTSISSTMFALLLGIEWRSMLIVLFRREAESGHLWSYGLGSSSHRRSIQSVVRHRSWGSGCEGIYLMPD